MTLARGGLTPGKQPQFFTGFDGEISFREHGEQWVKKEVPEAHAPPGPIPMIQPCGGSRGNDSPPARVRPTRRITAGSGSGALPRVRASRRLGARFLCICEG